MTRSARATGSNHALPRAGRTTGLLRALALGAGLVLSPLAHTDELQDVSKLVANGKLDEADQRADAYLKNTPKDAQMRFLKAVILSRQGKRDAAVALFTGLTQDYPELPEPYNNLAVIYAAQGQYDNARVALETAVRISPDDVTAYENLGDVYAAMAARAYRDARLHDPRNAVALRKLDTIRTVLTGPAATATAPPPASRSPAPAAAPNPSSQRNVGQAYPAAPSALTSFGATAPEIVVPSADTAVPQGSNVVAVGVPDKVGGATTSTLPDTRTTVPSDPVDPIPAITLAVQRWASSRSMKAGELNIRVDGDVAIARFREEPSNVRKSEVRHRELTLHRNAGDWAVTDERIES